MSVPRHSDSKRPKPPGATADSASTQPRGAMRRRWLLGTLVTLACCLAIAASAVTAAHDGGRPGIRPPVPDSAEQQAHGADGSQHGAGPHSPLPQNVSDPKAATAEQYTMPDPNLPGTPSGGVKRFVVQAFEHVTRVSSELPPLRVWSYGVNGVQLRGTGASPPMVVNQGDMVDITFINGGSAQAQVVFGHSLDLHAAEVPPPDFFKTLPPGGRLHYTFRANHPGVYLYHCASQPMLMHLGAGMAGMMVVKPHNLPPVDRELWLVQQEYFPGKQGEDPDFGKMMSRDPSVVTFNGFAFQYRDHPIPVRVGEKIRLYIVNAGPTQSSEFHVIGGVFDRWNVEGATGHDSQTVSLGASQGGWVDFSLKRKGVYPFVTHNFVDMTLGAEGALIASDAAADTAALK